MRARVVGAGLLVLIEDAAFALLVVFAKVAAFVLLPMTVVTSGDGDGDGDGEELVS